jgi:hypothetical protein
MEVPKKRKEYRQIWVSPEVQDRWNEVKRLYNFKSSNDLIEYLLDTFE